MIMRISFFLASLILAGCSADIPDTDYFPLQKGVVWEYQVNELFGSRESQREFSIENLGETQFKEGEVFSEDLISVRHTSDGTDYYILKDDTGVYRAARRTLIEYKPRFEKSLVRILPNNKDLEVGRSWTVPTKPYALHATASFAVPDPRKRDINLQFEIKSVTDTVEVPAGTFERCIRVEGTTVLTLYVDPKLGYQDIPITQTEWYAPGVGLVKLIREEPLNMELFKGGLISYELSRFDP